uniref:Uncharacterized protein n=1 Tax=Oryza glumipatula TaxID=40148 RepID=A0A0E0BJZ1_9ORYZ
MRRGSADRREGRTAARHRGGRSSTATAGSGTPVAQRRRRGAGGCVRARRRRGRRRQQLRRSRHYGGGGTAAGATAAEARVAVAAAEAWVTSAVAEARLLLLGANGCGCPARGCAWPASGWPARWLVSGAGGRHGKGDAAGGRAVQGVLPEAVQYKEEHCKLARHEKAWPEAAVQGDTAEASVAVLAGAVTAQREVRPVETEPGEASVSRQHAETGRPGAQVQWCPRAGGGSDGGGAMVHSCRSARGGRRVKT